MKTGIELITQEREKQIVKHGRTIELDRINNSTYQLNNAIEALVHLSPQDLYETGITEEQSNKLHLTSLPNGWNSEIWLKMKNKSYKERLIIAGALIAAEIDRIQN